MVSQEAAFYEVAFVSPPKQRCVDLTAPQVAFLEHYSERRPATCPQESFVSPTCSSGDARHAQSDRRAGLASGHAPRRAGPEPGAAALVGRGRGRYHDGNHHNHPPPNGLRPSRLRASKARYILTRLGWQDYFEKHSGSKSASCGCWAALCISCHLILKVWSRSRRPLESAPLASWPARAG